MQMLHDSGLTGVIREESRKKPFLGICLGMQLIFEKGYEFEECDGLGLIPGKVEKIEAPGMVIPHMGWNKLEMQHDCPILRNLPELAGTAGKTPGFSGSKQFHSSGRCQPL